MMPGLNGYECCRMVREKYTIAEMPIVFITAKNRISDLVFGFECGGSDYILKPFLREELIARVNAQIHQREAVDAIKEVTRLKADLADRIIESVHLKQIQDRLTRLLHSVDDGLIVTNENGQILFVNSIILTMLHFNDETDILGLDVSHLIHPEARQTNLMTAKLSRQKFAPVMFSDSDGNAIELPVKRISVVTSDEQMIAFIMRCQNVKLPDATAKMSDWIFTELEKNQERIAELEQISAECVAANKRMMEQLTEVHFSKADPFALGNRIMIDTISLWKESTGKEKWDFAEASGLWKVHPDEDGWQRTATLDKYLDFRKMPKFPRWINVIESARFVIREAEKRSCKSGLIQELRCSLNELDTVLKGQTTLCRN
jgi:two-component system sensor histidine kinase ChiS